MILESCYCLPERPGVYYFYNSENTLLYIGKSINIRKRVLSHFYNINESKRHAEMMHQTTFINYQCTAGELGALLLESAEVKKQQPLFNRRLRQLKHLYSWVLTDDFKPHLMLVDEIKDDQVSVGLYQSPHRAKYWLKKFIEKNQLCAKVLELEKTTRSCFNFQIKRCLGVCCDKEPLDIHNQRLVKAFESFSVISWQWSGPIAIIEEDHLHQLKQCHIINQWRYMTTVTDLNNPINAPLPLFSRDSYQIVISFLKHNNPEIIELSKVDTPVPF
ncbi:endonuclease [Entomomonas moraniae]|uniref:Excinuclease cho n=1 Tax=Entomomonas moraniae TaxID=2213226 RepID=A0A3Q9JHA9_9GAMM|nr:GIY-YIG nuclease family protein [Entomomonas moraniae]AZS49459.1 endonuclease [Entomomonas moraniae]